MKTIPVAVMVIAAFAASCTSKPRLDPSQIQSVQVQTSQAREVTPSEVNQLVAAYQGAEILKDQLVGTTPDVSVSVLLKSGETLRICGGNEPFQVVSLGERQVNVYGKDLEDLLRRFMRETQ